jgi:predicted DCC family thiol-disulfide oxidoreductase YuxK
MHQQAIILFDGVCNLCNSVVKFVIKRDKNAYFNFASLQSNEGSKLLQEFHLPSKNLNSFILIENGKAYSKSTGALKVAKRLNTLWPLLYAFILIPKVVRDKIYDVVAVNRYKWFGKKEECILPTAQLKARFLN